MFYEKWQRLMSVIDDDCECDWSVKWCLKKPLTNRIIDLSPMKQYYCICNHAQKVIRINALIPSYVIWSYQSFSRFVMLCYVMLCCSVTTLKLQMDFHYLLDILCRRNEFIKSMNFYLILLSQLKYQMIHNVKVIHIKY